MLTDAALNYMGILAFGLFLFFVLRWLIGRRVRYRARMEPVPDCPKCDRPMVRRTARRGANAGREFWGCSEFPRCRGTVHDQVPADAATETDASVQIASPESTVAAPIGRSATLDCSRCGHADTRRGRPYRVWRIAPVGFWPLLGLVNLFIAILVPPRPRCSWCHGSRSRRAQASYDYDPFLHDNPHSRDQMALRRHAAVLRPDASTGRWQSEERHTVIRYLAWRDGGRCGLCAMPLPTNQGQIEHVIPKKFGHFDFSNGRASPGTTLESKLHHVDNLQVAHDYCNRAKGNNAAGIDWRHPGLPSLPVAKVTIEARTYLWVPDRQKSAGSRS